MSHPQPRTFVGSPAVRKQVWLMIGIVGASFSGKTYSGLRLARGIQRVTGGKIGFLDTERGRGTHYAKSAENPNFFDFIHYPFDEPFDPGSYLAGILQMKKDGCTVGIIDQMSYEHTGPGGIMDQIDKFLDDDWQKREKMNMVAHARIKPQRRKFNEAVSRLDMHLIFLYHNGRRQLVEASQRNAKESSMLAGHRRQPPQRFTIQ